MATAEFECGYETEPREIAEALLPSNFGVSCLCEHTASVSDGCISPAIQNSRLYSTHSSRHYTLVRSSPSSSGPAGGASDGYGLGRQAASPVRRCTTTGLGTPSHHSERIHPYVGSCSATGTDWERMRGRKLKLSVVSRGINSTGSISRETISDIVKSCVGSIGVIGGLSKGSATTFETTQGFSPCYGHFRQIFRQARGLPARPLSRHGPPRHAVTT